jgi:hypothetical protein
LKLKLGFKETTSLCRYKILYSIYDELSAVRLDFDVELVSSDLPLEVTNMIYISDSYAVNNSASSGTNLSKLETKLDTLKGYKSYNHSIRLLNFENLTKDIFDAAKYKVTIYDQDLNEVDGDIYPRTTQVSFASFNHLQFFNNFFSRVFFIMDVQIIR